MSTSDKRGKMAATITVRFPAEEYNALSDLMRHSGMSFSEAIRAAVREYAAGHPATLIVPGARVDGQNVTVPA